MSRYARTSRVRNPRERSTPISRRLRARLASTPIRAKRRARAAVGRESARNRPSWGTVASFTERTAPATLAPVVGLDASLTLIW